MIVHCRLSLQDATERNDRYTGNENMTKKNVYQSQLHARVFSSSFENVIDTSVYLLIETRIIDRSDSRINVKNLT